MNEGLGNHRPGIYFHIPYFLKYMNLHNEYDPRNVVCKMASSRPRDYPVGRGSVGAAVMTGSRRERVRAAAAQASMTRTCLTDTGELAGARGGGRGRSRREARRR